LPQTNESATVAKSKKFRQLNQALIFGLGWVFFCVRAAQTVLRPCLVSKNFQDSPSHRIFIHMHEVLNIDENKN